MPKNLDIKRKYAEKYGGFLGAIIYLVHQKLGLVSFGETNTMKIDWLEHDIPNKASLVSNVTWISIVTVGLGGSWQYAVGASVVALTLDKLFHEIKIAGENK